MGTMRATLSISVYVLHYSILKPTCSMFQRNTVIHENEHFRDLQRHLQKRWIMEAIQGKVQSVEYFKAAILYCGFVLKQRYGCFLA